MDADGKRGRRRPGRAAVLCLGLLPAAVLCGCRMFPPAETAYVGPQLPPAPTLEQIAAFVNGNSTRIQTFVADEAVISGPGIPSLRTQIAFERPRRLRMRGETGLSGMELDVGSNDEVFWFWVKRNQPPAMYYARWADYDLPGSAARQAVPLDPRWLAEAFGIVEIDLSSPTEGPVPLAGNRLEVRTRRQTPEGPMVKVIVVDAQYGLVLAQHLYDPQGRLSASAVSYDHRRDPVSGLVMPRAVELQVPRAEMTLRVHLGNVRINQPIPDPAATWNMPTYAGYPLVNLADPTMQAVPIPQTQPVVYSGQAIVCPPDAAVSAY